jgi:hypothetical protein
MRYSPTRVLLSVVALSAAASAQSPPDPGVDIDAILARARAACARGDQRAALGCGLELRSHDAKDLRGHYLIGSVSASIGPCFSRVVAEQALARVASLLRGDNVVLLRGLAGVPARADLQGVSALLGEWRRELAAGKRLLLVADPAAAERLAGHLRARIEQVEAWAVRERDRLERARKQRAEGERTLRREQTRKRRAGETFADVQPIVDRIHASDRTIQTCVRRVQEYEAQLEELRAEVERVAACVR